MKTLKKKSTPPQLKNSGTPFKSFGPVPNLEDYVQPDWWNRIFNSIYLKTDSDVVDDRKVTSREISRFCEILNLSRENSILDLCCGQGRHSIELARKGFRNVEGLDRSRYLIQKAKSRANKEGLSLRFREGEARSLPYASDTFDRVMILGNSFGYFESIMDDLKVLKEVFRVLKPWGMLLVDITDGDYIREQFQPRSWEWIDKNLFVCRERTLSMDSQSLISREVVTHVEKGVIADQFYAERLYSRENLYQLLKTAGYTGMTDHGSISTESERNQDLGMMEQRIIYTAVVKKEWAPVKAKKTGTANIVVILGDPSKDDPLKPSSVFDDDDYYTIDQMKNALMQLKEYNFTFIDNHDSLIQDLIKQKSGTDFIFNLCDEGYNNNPRLELHIPSILEVLGMEYSGSGPQCLAFCYDKSLVRGIAKEMGIPVPEAVLVDKEDTIFEIPLLFPVLIKPNFGDSSFGITQNSYAGSIQEVISSVSEIRVKLGYEKPVLIEEFLPGKDLSVGIIGNIPDSYTVLPIIEEDYSHVPGDLPRICGYEAKWDPSSPYWKIKSVPAELDESVEKFIVECCLKLAQRLDCRDYVRFDWRLDSNGNPKLLEVNPNPGWCWDGHLAKMAGFHGYNYSEMLEAILKATQQRLKMKTIRNGVFANRELN